MHGDNYGIEIADFGEVRVLGVSKQSTEGIEEALPGWLNFDQISSMVKVRKATRPNPAKIPKREKNWPRVKAEVSVFATCLIEGPIRSAINASSKPNCIDSYAAFFKYGISGEFFVNIREKYFDFSFFRLTTVGNSLVY